LPNKTTQSLQLSSVSVGYFIFSRDQAVSAAAAPADLPTSRRRKHHAISPASYCLKHQSIRNRFTHERITPSAKISSTKVTATLQSLCIKATPYFIM
jgi:hypothetical protein